MLPLNVGILPVFEHLEPHRRTLHCQLMAISVKNDPLVMSETIVVDEIIIPVTVNYLEEDRVYQVSCPWLQGRHAWGETLDEAMRAIPGNIWAMIQARRDDGSPHYLEGR